MLIRQEVFRRVYRRAIAAAIPNPEDITAVAAACDEFGSQDPSTLILQRLEARVKHPDSAAKVHRNNLVDTESEKISDGIQTPDTTRTKNGSSEKKLNLIRMKLRLSSKRVNPSLKRKLKPILKAY
jgi:hypothetical protein